MTRASNVTIEIRSQNDRFGEPINESTGSYSGCIGLLQTNQSDAILFLNDYPHPAANISQGLVMTDATIDMITSYRPSDQSVRIQVERAFNSFRPSVRILCAVTMFICICALCVKEIFKSWHRRMISLPTRPRHKRAPYEVITHMTRFGQLSNSAGQFRKILFLVLSLFSFLVIFFLCSSIKTELVVIPPPKTLRSYQQLLDHQCGVFFFSGGNSYQSFQSAAKGSKEKALWDFSVSKYSMSSVVYSYGNRPETDSAVLNSWIRGESAIIVHSDWAPFFMKPICSAMLNREKRDAFALLFKINGNEDLLLPLRSRDEEAMVFQKSFTWNPRSSSSLNQVMPTLRRVMEAGITEFIMKYMATADVVSIIQVSGKGNATFANMEKCKSSEFFRPENTVKGVKADNFANFPTYAVYLVSLELLVLLIEVLVGRCIKRKGSRLSTNS